METYNQTALPPRSFDDEEPLNLKDAEETYDVYVNQSYVGKKFVATEHEGTTGIMNFLKAQGVDNISTKIDGDHYIVETDDEKRVTQVLDVYLNNR